MVGLLVCRVMSKWTITKAVRSTIFLTLKKGTSVGTLVRTHASISHVHANFCTCSMPVHISGKGFVRCTHVNMHAYLHGELVGSVFLFRLSICF